MANDFKHMISHYMVPGYSVHFTGSFHSWLPHVSFNFLMSVACLSKALNHIHPLTHWGRDKVDTISQTFKCIFLNETFRITIKISLKFVPKGPINNIPALVQIMAWRRSGDKPLSESMMVRLLKHICVTRPQWVNYKGFILETDYIYALQQYLAYGYRLVMGK